MHIEKIMTKTGEEKTMVVESPRGSREKDVKMKISLSPPVRDTRKSTVGTQCSRAPVNDNLL